MTIGEISEKTNLPESTLRYYEKKGLIKESRDKNVRRDNEENDIKYVLEQKLKWEEYLQNLDNKIEFYKQSIKKNNNQTLE